MAVPSTTQPSRRAAFAWVAVAYLGAAVVALVVGYALRAEHPLLVAAAADIAGTLVVFGFSVAFDNSSFYDPYWSVAPPALAAYFALAPCPPCTFDGSALRAVLVAMLVFGWGARLTANWVRGWQGLGHEDWRYVDLRTSQGRLYWPVSLVGLHLMPTAMVFGGCLSVYAALESTGSPVGWLDAVAAAVTATAIAIEATADGQLRRFVRSSPPPGATLTTGLWALSRHPNYFGEVLFWWGLYLFALAQGADRWWAGIGPLAITLLFLFVSLPLIERRMLARRPGYAERQRTVSRLVPLPPRRP